MPVNNADDLRERLRNRFETIRTIPNIFERLRDSMLRREVTCVDARGEYFKYFL